MNTRMPLGGGAYRPELPESTEPLTWWRATVTRPWGRVDHGVLLLRHVWAAPMTTAPPTEWFRDYRLNTDVLRTDLEDLEQVPGHNEVSDRERNLAVWEQQLLEEEQARAILATSERQLAALAAPRVAALVVGEASDARAAVNPAVERVREAIFTTRCIQDEDLAALLAEHDRLAAAVARWEQRFQQQCDRFDEVVGAYATAADPVAVVAGVDLEGVLAGHAGWRGASGAIFCDSCDCVAATVAGHAAHQAERVRAALTAALRGES